MALGAGAGNNGAIVARAPGSMAETTENRSFRERGGWWVVAQLPLLVLAYVIPIHYGRALPLEHLDLPGGVGVALLVAGVLQTAVSMLTLGRGLTPYPRPLEGAVLRTQGAYAIVRHPIYGGILFMSVGWSLFQHSLAGFVVAVLLLVFFDRKAALEERWLMQKFPEEYALYRQRVRKLIPGIY